MKSRVTAEKSFKSHKDEERRAGNLWAVAWCVFVSASSEFLWVASTNTCWGINQVSPRRLHFHTTLLRIECNSNAALIYRAARALIKIIPSLVFREEIAADHLSDAHQRRRFIAFERRVIYRRYYCDTSETSECLFKQINQSNVNGRCSVIRRSINVIGHSINSQVAIDFRVAISPSIAVRQVAVRCVVSRIKCIRARLKCMKYSSSSCEVDSARNFMHTHRIRCSRRLIDTPSLKEMHMHKINILLCFTLCDVRSGSMCERSATCSASFRRFSLLAATRARLSSVVQAHVIWTFRFRRKCGKLIWCTGDFLRLTRLLPFVFAFSATFRISSAALNRVLFVVERKIPFNDVPEQLRKWFSR
jgi:hypothetical protein